MGTGNREQGIGMEQGMEMRNRNREWESGMGNRE